MNKATNGAAAAAAAIACTTLITQAAGGPTSWNNGAGGFWGDSANWNPMSVPNEFDPVLISLGGSYTVSVNATQKAASIDITNPTATLGIRNARLLEVFGDVLNDGLIIVNEESNVSATLLDFEASSVLSGSGTLRLNSIGARAQVRTGASGVTLTNDGAHTIDGLGQISAELINNATVRANVPANELFLLGSDKTNNSIMEATSTGILDISSLTLTQGVAGEVRAVGAGSRVDLNGTTIIGGTVWNDPGSSIEILSATFDGVDFSAGTLNIQNGRTLEVFNSLDNNGTVVINPEASVSSTSLIFENTGSLTGSGEVILNSFGARSRLRTGMGETLTNAAGHTIRGRGQLEASLINNGLVSADVPGDEMFILTNDKVNNATMEAINTSTLDFASIMVTNTGAEIIADGIDSRIDLTGTTIVGGDLLALNGALIDVNSATLDGVDFEGLLNLRNARTLTITNSINNNGTIVVNSDANVSATQIVFTNDGAFNGSGSVNLNSFASRARIISDPGVTITNPSTHTIFGRGQIEASLINNGLIRSDVAGDEMFFTANDKTNNATMLANNASAFDIMGITLTQGPAGQLSAEGADARIDLTGATIEGGQLNATGGAHVDVYGGTLSGIVCDAPINLLNAFTLSIAEGVTNNNTIVVNAQGSVSATNLAWTDDTELGGTGTVLLNSLSSRSRLTLGPKATVATLGQGQRLEGIGSIDAPLVHNGTTAPGLSIGTMFATQPIAYASTSVFEAEVDGTTADLLDSSNTIELDGVLEVQFIDGFAPSGFWARKIMEGSDITDKFTTVIVPPPAAGFVTRVYNTGTELFVGQTCPSDTNLDGALNFFDVSVFLNNYNNGDLAADLNGDGVLNFFDVSTFLNSYNMGC